jgi:hypothetical protein
LFMRAPCTPADPRFRAGKQALDVADGARSARADISATAVTISIRSIRKPLAMGAAMAATSAESDE